MGAVYYVLYVLNIIHVFICIMYCATLADAIHYFRHLVDHKVVVPTFVKTVDQRADGFTKPLGKTLFRVWVKYLLQFAD